MSIGPTSDLTLAFKAAGPRWTTPSNRYKTGPFQPRTGQQHSSWASQRSEPGPPQLLSPAVPSRVGWELSRLLEFGKVGCALPGDNEYKRLFSAYFKNRERSHIHFHQLSHKAILRWKHSRSKHEHTFRALGTMMGAGHTEFTTTETCPQEERSSLIQSVVCVC